MTVSLKIDAWQDDYSYIYATDFEEAEDFRASEYTLQILTNDGVKIYETADTFYVNGTKYEVKNMTEDTASAVTDLISRKVAEITFSGGAVKKIVTYEEGEFELADGSVSGEYDAENSKIGTVEFDEDTTVADICMQPT